MLVPRYKLSLCHTPIKPDLLGFPGIGVFACGLCDHVITRFASGGGSHHVSNLGLFFFEEAFEPLFFFSKSL
jgi:hypothetical protein